jgi:hypothetical protein
MSKDLFKRTKSLLQDHIRILNEHRIGDTHVEDAEAIISEIEHLLKSDAVDKIEDQIDEAERMIVSDDLAQEILNARYCVGGSCDD